MAEANLPHESQYPCFPTTRRSPPRVNSETAQLTHSKIFLRPSPKHIAK